MKDLMIDLETLSTESDAAIVSIGAVYFDPHKKKLGHQCYLRVDLESSMKCGGKVSASTLRFWLEQDRLAREELIQAKTGLPEALNYFSKFLDEDVKVWGNGSDFDNVILANAYRSVGMLIPWEFYNNRCYRTVKNFCPDIEMQREGHKHHAMDDAISQARHLMSMPIDWDNAS